MTAIDETRQHVAPTPGLLKNQVTLGQIRDKVCMPDKPEVAFHSEYSFDFSATYSGPLLAGFRLLVDALCHVFGRQIRRSARNMAHEGFALSIKTKKETWSGEGKSR